MRLAAIAVGALLMAPTLAEARECLRYDWQQYRRRCDASEGFFGSCPRAHWVRRCVEWAQDYERDYRRRDPRPERVYGYAQRRVDDDPAERGACKAERVTAVSDEHKDVDRARTDAIERWRKAVSWSGGGGEFMDYSLAVNREFRCGPSSPGDGWVAKGGKFLAKTYGAATGQQGGAINADGMNQRCQVWATPCRARRELDATEPRP